MPASSRSISRSSSWIAPFADLLGLILVLASLTIAFALTTPYFFSAGMFATLANENAGTILVAVGMTYVLLIGGIDLSVGSVVGLSGVVIGHLMLDKSHPFPLLAAAIGTMLVGALCGAFNGLITNFWSIPSFVVTLGMMEIARGLAHQISQSRTAYIGERAGAIADANLLGLSLPFWIALAAVALGQLGLTHTIFGRSVLAVGGNEEAARFSGINTKRVKLMVFILVGFLSAAAAVVNVSKKQSADPNAGNGLELDVIAAVVIGGTSLLGGRGSVVKSLLGVAIIAVLGAGLSARGAHDETKRLVTGCVIILAVILDYYRQLFGEARSN
jgi:ribose transport system permease protein